MDNKGKFAILTVFGLVLLLYAAYWYRSLKPVNDMTREVKVNSDRRRGALAEADASDASAAGGGVNAGAPRVTIEEVRAPHLVTASPAHGSVVELRDLTTVTLTFDAPLAQGARIVVLTGHNAVANGGVRSPDGRTLTVDVDQDTFGLSGLPQAPYDVLYDACFAEEPCSKGQYGFAGVQL